MEKCLKIQIMLGMNYLKEKESEVKSEQIYHFQVGNEENVFSHNQENKRYMYFDDSPSC